MTSTQDLTAYAPALKGLAIAGSLWTAGSMTTAYRLFPSIHPVVQSSRKIAAKQWDFFYTALKNAVKPTDPAVFLTCITLAYFERHENKAGLKWKLWATAAGVMPVGWIWVWTMATASDNRLMAAAYPESELGEGEKTDSPSEQRKTIEDLKEFNSVMGVRMMVPWTVAALALFCSLSE